MAELAVKNGSCIDWQKQCLALETQLFKFRLQASKIRELLAEKMQELEQRVIEAEQRAQSAEKQAEVMEEKLKLANTKTSELNEHKKYQELMNRVQERDELINKLKKQLEEQKQLRAQEAKIVQEKATKIKDWVTAKLRELELENHYLRGCNLRLTEQIEALQKALQVIDMTTQSVSSCSVQLPRDPLSSLVENSDQDSKLLTADIKQAYQSVSANVVTGVVFVDDSCIEGETETSEPAQSSLRLMSDSSHDKDSSEKDFISMTFPRISTSPQISTSLNPQTDTAKFHGALIFQSPLEELQKSISDLDKIASVLYNPSDELSNKFHPHKLDLSSREITGIHNCSVSPSVAALKLSTNVTSVPSSFSRMEGGSMTLPKARTPSKPRDSIQLAKRHYSQPQSGTDCFHHVVNIEISKLQCIRAPKQCQREVEETDIDEVAEKMEMDDCLLQEGGMDKESPQNLCSCKEMRISEARVRDSADKPPTPPLHRFPSWESRIYAVAKFGMRMSEVALGNASSSQTSNSPTYSSPGPFTSLVYRNVTVPVYTMLKGKATQISNVPFLDESSCSDDDCSSHVSLRTSNAGSEPQKTSRPGSPRAMKRGVSVSSLSSESDYAIPPDAYSLDGDHSEPEHKLQRTSSYSTDVGVYSEPLEKSGYLLKMSNQVKTWKRRWFVLRNEQLMYYKSPSDIICKPQGLVDLNSSCQIIRGEGYQTFQLVTEKRTYFLTADSPNILEEWIHVLQNVIKVKVTSPTKVPLSDAKPTVKGWLTKVKHGRSKLVWCALIGKTFYYYRNHEDKCPLGYLYMRESKVEEVDHSCDSDEDYEASRGLFSSYCTLVIHSPDQSPVYLLIGTKQEKDTWLYHLTVAAGSSSAKVGSAYEQVIGKLLDAEGDPSSPLWKHPMLCYSKDGLYMPLTTLPSEALQTEALKLFKSCQLFINVPVEAPSIDYHVSLAQTALQVCLTHNELQNEIYCQLVKQTSRPAQNHSAIQCWQLLALCVPLFLPQHHFLWYIKHYLLQHGDPRSEIGKYAIYCQRSVERTLQVGEREARPSRMEIISILLRNPYHHSLPFSIPVHFMNGTYQVVGFDGSSTVEEFLHQLNQEMGMRQSSFSGFALFADDPSGGDIEHCLQGPMKICDVISKWEQALKELNPGKYEGGTRIVKLTYKNRQYFRYQAKGETDRERLLLAFQISGDIASGRFPVNKELALEMAALMAQVDYGDLDRPVLLNPGGSSHSKMQHLLQMVLDKFYPKHYKHHAVPEQIRQLADQLAAKWMMLHGCSSPECVRIFLTVARKWPLFGAKLFIAKPVLPFPLEDSPLWIAVNEDGISILEYSTMHLKLSYTFSSVLTFGGCHDNFMIVISQAKDRHSGKTTPEKLLFAMAAPMIAEVTLLIASYINYRSSTPYPPVPSLNSTRSTSSTKKCIDIESSYFFPSVARTTKGPTLL
ncbi:pleckstrin homology domain-containing family H member 1 isoform X2 [Sphaerodactylus townsendi]|uniref:pleckstrin homology domain-containing family H member 1 isoform X2 n=1 Tax=Sphaerodactylus townsendi TaxID=933632 RepID=UPI002026E14D|nr:pleckstrin homology domain-containing family H member 1 isoform X2 [Sphaerodactylus townsendi]